MSPNWGFRESLSAREEDFPCIRILNVYQVDPLLAICVIINDRQEF